MPFNNEDIEEVPQQRKVQRACDLCRRKKIRCDGTQMSDKECTNCATVGHDCTYLEGAKKRGPPKSYLDNLKNRIEGLERLISEVSPEALVELDRSWEPVLESGSSRAPGPSSFKSREVLPPPPHSIKSVSPGIGGSSLQHDNIENLFLADNLNKMALHNNRFFGKSSETILLEAVSELKRGYVGGISNSSIPEYQPIPPCDILPDKPTRLYSFPDDDLMHSLIDLYFIHMNLFLPLLHRATFERCIAENLHLTDEMFGFTLLLVCAVASRYSNDPRVLLDNTNSLHSAGWKWFSQVPMVKRDPLKPSCLYEIQYYCLVGQYLHASSVPQACWTVVGFGIRAAQDVGAHRRKSHTHTLTVEDELWKRAFWVLVCMDRLFSSSCGRPCSIHDEDFDIEMPIACDDEYWEHPDPQQRFQQPPNKPSVVVYFNAYIKLSQILASVLRTVYAVNKSKILLGFAGPHWEEEIVADLDSDLNKWIDDVPDHLRWDPKRENAVFFNQSASLYCFYYHIQILIHRPFIPSPRRPVPLSSSPLATCTAAARSCSHVASIQGSRFPIAPPPIQTTAFSAGAVLLLNIWGGKRSGVSTDPNKEMIDVHKCMDVLKASEERWFMAGRLWDILYELASKGDLPLPSTTLAKNKRERDEDKPPLPPSSSNPSSSTTEDCTTQFMGVRRNIAGPRRLNSLNQLPQQVQQPTQPVHYQDFRQQCSPQVPPLYTLLENNNELGRISHNQSQFSGQSYLSSHNTGAQYWYSGEGEGDILTSIRETEMSQLPFDGGLMINHQHGYAPGVTPFSVITPFDQVNVNMNYQSNDSYTHTHTLIEERDFSSRASSSHQSTAMHPHPGMSAGVSTPRFSSNTEQQRMPPLHTTYAVWSSGSSGIELDNWGNYPSNVNDLSRRRDGRLDEYHLR